MDVTSPPNILGNFLKLCQLSPYFRGIHICIVSVSFLSIFMNLSLRNICFFCSLTVKF